MTIEDAILVNVYRTRLYAPLLLLTLMYVLFPAVRELTVRFYNRVNIMKSRDIILLLLVVTFLSSWMVCYHGKSWGGDYSQYFAQCRALTTGTLAEWYKKNVFIINTSSEGIGSDVYPWIWPILLTPMYRIFGFNVAVLKVYECVFMAMTVIPLYCIYEKRFSKANSLLLCLLSVLNIKILIDVNTIESDIPYMLFALTAAYFIEKAREHSSLSSIKWGGCAGILMFVATETKTMGKGLLVALLFYDLFQVVHAISHKTIYVKLRNQWIYYKYLTPYLAYGISTFLFHLVLPASGGTYNDYFVFTIERLLYNSQKYWGVYTGLVGSSIRPLITVISVAGLILILIFALVGAIRYWKQESYIILYIGITMGMLLFYDYIAVRFVYAVYPFIILLSGLGCRALYQKIGTSYKGKIQNIVALLHIIYMVMLMVSLIAVGWKIQRHEYDLNEANSEKAEETYAYINKYIDDDAVIYFFKPRVLYLNTNVYAYTRYDQHNALDKADYVLLNMADGYTDVRDDIMSMKLKKIFDNKEFQLYQINDKSVKQQY